ncbi:MFS transporter [Novosphingobium sp. AAP93]|uniref:MFS transporter n=1 Tax=Novosphingobium sp. AAP93 TaxID=1523427 RepID=UPI0006B89321|nr:MFS transporter [Novosphingobium sp. AAP93]
MPERADAGEARHKNEYEAIFRDNPRVPPLILLLFAGGSFGAASFIVAPQLLLLFFMTEQLGIPPVWAGAALFVPKLWELVLDPVIGVWSDATSSRWGRRRPFLLAGLVLLPLGLALLFAVPSFAAWPMRLAWVSLAFLVATTGYSLFAVPYVALPGELAPDPVERTRLIACRMVFVALGILAAGAGAPLLIEALGGGRAAYAVTGGIFAVLAGLSLFGSFIAAGHAPIEQGRREMGVLASLPGATLRAVEFRALLVTYGLQMVASGLNAAMLAYAVRYLLHATESLTGLIFGLFTLASLGVTPVAAWFGGRIGKRRALVLFSLIYAAGLALFWFSAPSRLGALWLAAVLSGAGNAGTQVFAFALLPDVLERERARTGEDRTAAFTGIWTSCEKLGLAAGGAIGGVGLSIAGFVEGASEQNAATQTLIAVLLSLAPAALMLVSLPLLGAVESRRLHGRFV